MITDAKWVSVPAPDKRTGSDAYCGGKDRSILYEKI